jgi:anti-anti-sigma factor
MLEPAKLLSFQHPLKTTHLLNDWHGGCNFNRRNTNLEGRKMAAPAYCFTTLKIDMDEKPEEITVRCSGKITAESASMFEREVRDNSIPISRGKGVAVINRIVLDLSKVTHIDNAGLEALLGIWTAGQRKSCSVEIVNFASAAGKLSIMRGFDHLLGKMRAILGLV